MYVFGERIEYSKKKGRLSGMGTDWMPNNDARWKSYNEIYNESLIKVYNKKRQSPKNLTSEYRTKKIKRDKCNVFSLVVKKYIPSTSKEHTIEFVVS